MQRTDFFYNLPPELIAQHHAEPRDSSRLMRLDRKTGHTADYIFRDIIDLLQPGDLLVVNDSKVIPARLLGEKRGTGAKVEILLLRDLENDRWECLAKPGRRLRKGAQILFSDALSGVITDEIDDGNRIIELQYDSNRNIYELLDETGLMPLPHYITAPLSDNNSYQTVYADARGSVAAPTAGLHFTPELLEALQKKGIGLAKVTLHVGLGTFRPVKADIITDHHMHSEWYTINESTAQQINECKKQGGRVIAVGTTSCRTLESCVKKYGSIVPCSENTDIFIYPGYSFGAIDGLITNFHLPESTLIMLVSAFAGYEHTMAAYQEAVNKSYRFFSFGDAMLIL